MTLHQNYIAGEWVGSDDMNANINPSDTSDVVGEYARASREQAQSAIDAAAAALPGWSRSGVQQRANILDAVGDVCLQRRERAREAVLPEQRHAAELAHEELQLVDQLGAVHAQRAADRLARGALRVREVGLEAVAGDELGARVLGERLHRQVVEVELPRDRVAARRRTGDVELVGRPVRRDADLDEREEPVALEDVRPVQRPLVGQLVGPRVDHRLGALGEQPGELLAAARELLVGQQALEPHAEVTDLEGEPRRADDLGQRVVSFLARAQRGVGVSNQS